MQHAKQMFNLQFCFEFIKLVIYRLITTGNYNQHTREGLLKNKVATKTFIIETSCPSNRFETH